MRGFAVPLLLIVVLLFGGVALYFFSANFNENIKGVSTSTVAHTSPGIAASIIADTPAWDLVEFLCSSAEECLSSLNSGKRLSTVSGGATELREVEIVYENSWANYEYLKFYVRPSWAIGQDGFRVVTKGDAPGTLVEKIPVGNDFQEVVLIPTVEVSQTFYKSATFSDR